jgi:CBS domain-containing protein
MMSVGCRHLPVMEGGRLAGIVSARDLLPLATAGVVE